MNIGIEFKIPNEYGNYLKQILDNIDREDYMWNITEDEVYITDNMKNSHLLFPQEIRTLSNSKFVDIISQESYYTAFLNIKLYLQEDNVVINNYDDFVKSSCILVLLITDNEFVEIYSKDVNILNTIYNNAVKNRFSNINYITEKNFKRKEFSAYSD